MAWAELSKASRFSPVSTKMYFSPEPPKPTLLRTPGKAVKAWRICCSMTCFLGRCPRSLISKVRVALRGSPAPEVSNGSAPAAPPPMVV